METPNEKASPLSDYEVNDRFEMDEGLRERISDSEDYVNYREENGSFEEDSGILQFSCDSTIERISDDECSHSGIPGTLKVQSRDKSDVICEEVSDYDEEYCEDEKSINMAIHKLPPCILGKSSECFLSKYLEEYIASHPSHENRLKSVTDPSIRKIIGEEIFPERQLTSRLRGLNTSQVAIESASTIMSKYSHPPGPLLQLMLDVFISTQVSASETRLAIFYAYNHLIQQFGNSVWSHAGSLAEVGLTRFCVPALIHSNNIRCTNNIQFSACIQIWRQRRVYSAATCERLDAILASGNPDAQIGKSQPSAECLTVDARLGGLETLGYLLATPTLDDLYQEATKGIDLDDVIALNPKDPDDDAKIAIYADRNNLFDQCSRISGQELILLHSASLDLAALIEESDANFSILKREIDKLTALLGGST